MHKKAYIVISHAIYMQHDSYSIAVINIKLDSYCRVLNSFLYMYPPDTHAVILQHRVPDFSWQPCSLYNLLAFCVTLLGEIDNNDNNLIM